MNNEDFIKAAFAQGLTEEQVRQAVSERNSSMGSQQPANQSPQNQPAQPQQSGLGGFIHNVVNSGEQAAGNFGSALLNVFNPDLEKNTIANVVRLPIGVGEKIGATITGDKNYSSGNTQRVDNLVNMYKDRYGGAQNIKDTLYNDPIGALLDLSTVFDAGGSAVGKIGDISKLDKIASAGDVLKSAGKITNPISQGSKIAGKVVGAAGDSRIGQMVQAPFSKDYLPGVDEAAQKAGVDLPVSAVTKNKVLQEGEALSSKTFFGQGLIDKVKTAHAKLGQMADDMSAKVSQSPDLKGTGEAIKNGFDNFQEEFNKNKDLLYNNVPKDVLKAPAVTDNTLQALNEIIASKAKDISGQSNVDFYTNIKNSLIDTNHNITFDNLKQTRSAIGNKMQNFNDPIATGDKGALSKLYSSLSNDLDQTATSSNPQYGQALQEANKYYRDNIQKINSSLGKTIKNADPEKLMDILVKPNSETQIQNVQEIVGPDAFKQLQTNFLHSLYNKSMKNGVIDAGKLETNINRYGMPTLNKVLSPGQLDELNGLREHINNINTMKTALQTGTKVSDGSQTAFLTKLAALGPIAFANPAAAIGVLGTDFGVNKLFSTGVGRKYLTSGVDMTGPVSRTLTNKAATIGKMGRLFRNANIANQSASNSGSMDAMRRAVSP